MGFFLEIAPSAAAALPKLAALFAGAEALDAGDVVPACTCLQVLPGSGRAVPELGPSAMEPCSAPSLPMGRGLEGLGVTPSCVLAPNSLSWLHKDSSEIVSVFVSM